VELLSRAEEARGRDRQDNTGLTGSRKKQTTF
jgi:hypothetical protein